MIRERMGTRGHSEIRRKRIEAVMSQTEDGKAQVEAGYHRIAAAAMMIKSRTEPEALPVVTPVEAEVDVTNEGQ